MKQSLQILLLSVALGLPAAAGAAAPLPLDRPAISRPSVIPEIMTVKVSGGEEAQLSIQLSHPLEELPTFQVVENRVEFVVKNVKFHDSLQGALELSAPHALIEKLAATAEGKNVRVSFLVNGGTGDLRQRVGLTKESNFIRLRLQPPNAKSPALELLKEEQKPFVVPVQAPKVENNTSLLQWIGLSFLVILSAIGAVFLVRFFRSRNGSQGTRKFLIESLAYYPYGPKIGVSLLKIGREFVLIGVTPHQVSFLSSLPALQAQYDSESRFERGQFQDAVEEEVKKLQKQMGL